MEYILLLVSVFCTLSYRLACNWFSKRLSKNGADLQRFNLLYSSVAAVGLLVLALIRSAAAPSLFTLLLGVLFGLLTAVSSLAMINALELGPLSYTSLICSAGMIIPALSGWLLFSEPVSVWKFVGTALMLISIAFSVWQKDDAERKASLKWLVLCLLAMLTGGLIGVLQKVHQASEHSAELFYFLAVSFTVSALYSAVLLFLLRKKGTAPSLRISQSRSLLWIALISGTTLAASHVLNLWLAGVMPSIIFFPVVNGVGLLLAVLASVVLFREKLTRIRWAGIVIGIIAVMLLCLA